MPCQTTKSKDVPYKVKNVLCCGGNDTEPSTIVRLRSAGRPHRAKRNGGIPDCASLDAGYAGRIAVAQRRPRLTPVGRRNEAIFAAETQISIAPRRSSGTLKMSLGS